MPYLSVLGHLTGPVDSDRAQFVLAYRERGDDLEFERIDQGSRSGWRTGPIVPAIAEQDQLEESASVTAHRSEEITVTDINAMH
jgi:hypothetical protein